MREEEESMYFIDPYEVEPNAPDPEHQVPARMVSFKASGNFHWLEQALDLDKQWFKRNCVQIEFLQNILQMIRAKKPTKGASARLPRQQDCLVALKVHAWSAEQAPGEKIFWFRNDPRFVSVVVKPGVAGLEDFQWFLQELAASIKCLQDSEEEYKMYGKKARQNPLPEALQAMVDGAVAAFMEHPRCASATYFPSRNEMIISRKDEVPAAKIRIKHLKRHLEKCEWAALLRQFGNAEAKGIEFLNADPTEDLPEPAAGADRGSSDDLEETSQVSSDFSMPKKVTDVGDPRFVRCKHHPIPPPGSGSSNSVEAPAIMSHASSEFQASEPAPASAAPVPARSSSGSASSCLVDPVPARSSTSSASSVLVDPAEFFAEPARAPTMQWHAEWGPEFPEGPAQAVRNDGEPAMEGKL